MPTFLLTHHFPDAFRPSPETAAAAGAWFDRLGPRLVTRPLDGPVETRRLGNCGAEEQRAYTLVATDTLEAAVALAEAWPLLARGGGVEVRALPIVTPSAQASASAHAGEVR